MIILLLDQVQLNQVPHPITHPVLLVGATAAIKQVSTI